MFTQARRFIGLVLAGALAATPAAAKDLVVHAGRLIDGLAATPRGPVSIIIKDDVIVAVQPGRVTPPGAEVIDLSDKTVMPGLIDAHVHLTSLKRSGDPIRKSITYSPIDMALAATVNARNVLEAGVTTVRDTGGLFGTDIALKKAIELGEVAGPRMWVAGEAIGPTGGHNDWSTGYAPDVSRTAWGAGLADGPDAVMKKVREEHRLGVSLIKILPSGGVVSVGDDPEAQLMNDAEIKAAVDTAHAIGLKVAAHAHGKSSIVTAVKLGVDSIEHGTYGDAETWRLMKERGAYFVPTLLTFERLYEAATKRPETLHPSTAKKVLEMGPRRGKALADAYRAGVKIALGSDTGLGENPKELALMVRAGMSPMDVIFAASRNAADLIGSDKIGAVAPGRYADLIAVNGDPLADISEVERVNFVMKGGIVYKRDGQPVWAPLVNP